MKLAASGARPQRGRHHRGVREDEPRPARRAPRHGPSLHGRHAGNTARVGEGGLPLRLTEIEEESFNQELHTTAARAALRDERADFVFPLDADEFLRADSRRAGAVPGRPSARSTSAPCVGSPTCRPRTTTPPRTPSSASSTLLTEPLAVLDLDYCKVVVGAWFAARADARIVEGNHAVFAAGAAATAPCRGVTVCHYPIRSATQAAEKAALGWLAQLASGRAVEGSPVSGHWRRIFRAEGTAS